MKIDFFIAGFQKAATTKVKEMLSRNSHILIHQMQEMTYFNKEDYKGATHNFFNEYYETLNNKKIIGAKSVSMAISESALIRLKEHNKNCKVILILRNPIKRAYSAYWYCRRMGWENENNFIKAINKPVNAYSSITAKRSCDYLGQGYYAQHIKIIQKYFKPNQIQILILEDELSDIEKVNKKLSAFLGIPYEPVNVHERSSVVNSSAMPKFMFITKVLKNKSILSTSLMKFVPNSIIIKIKSLKEHIVKLNERSFEQPEISQEAFDLLKLHFKDKNKELENLLNKELKKW